MKVKEITSFLDRTVPLAFQESYDNAGIQTGDPESEITSALLALDITEEVINEAVEKGCGLIIVHHPLLFHPLKRITYKTYQERILIKAIKNDIAIYASHTNLDVYENGVSMKMAEKISLQNVRVLSPAGGMLRKLVTFIPGDHLETVSNALFEAGAGVIGKYDRCGFTTGGNGTYRAGENTDPFRGEKGKVHTEKEARFETVFLSHLKDDVINALIRSHPYEEVAYDIYTLDNDYGIAGLGCKGDLPEPMSGKEFLNHLSEVFGAKGIRFSAVPEKPIAKVALCGGAGISLLGPAVASGCDAFVTGDARYHDFFNTESRLMLVDIGHYESEKYSTEIIYDLIIKKFPTFALRFSDINTNPINYL